MQTVETFGTPRETERAFYAAFESRSVEAMMGVWSDDVEIICIHPHGPKLVGRDAVQNSWKQILENSPALRFDVRDRRTLDGDLLVAHIVNEHIQVGDQGAWQGPILATNVYRYTQAGWRMVLHHASSTPEEVLSEATVTMH